MLLIPVLPPFCPKCKGHLFATKQHGLYCIKCRESVKESEALHKTDKPNYCDIFYE